MENPYQAPETTQAPAHSSAAPLTVKQILFTLQGRIPRRTYWLYTFLTIVPIYALIFFLMPSVVDTTDYTAMAVEQATQPESISPAIIVVAVILYILMLWTSICIAGKRWHDRDKSAWWICIAFVPIIGGFWALIENGCLRGTEGDNRYGADPT